MTVPTPVQSPRCPSLPAPRSPRARPPLWRPLRSFGRRAAASRDREAWPWTAPAVAAAEIQRQPIAVPGGLIGAWRSVTGRADVRATAPGAGQWWMKVAARVLLESQLAPRMFGAGSINENFSTAGGGLKE